MKHVLIILLAVSGCSPPEEEVSNCSMPADHVAQGKMTDGIRIHLEPSKNKYLIGEPVMFTMSLENQTQEDFEKWIAGITHRVRILISDGKGFHRFEFGSRGIPKLPKYTEPLPPGASTHYQFKMLYTFWLTGKKENKLAFPFPGTYCIKVRYPNFSDGKILESNVAHVTIKKPTGDDAKVWKTINRPSVLRFLQSGKLGEDEEDIPVELVDLIEQFPKSGYADGLKPSLRNYYQQQAGKMYPDQLKADPPMQRLRKLLDIEFEEDPGSFSNDQRLDVKIHYHYPMPTPYRQVFEEISKQCGVPLEAHQTLGRRTTKGIPRTQTLREFMVEKSSYKAKWIKDGNGYKLVPEPDK